MAVRAKKKKEEFWRSGGMVWYGMVWYGMVWYGMVWYGMVWYGMVWYGMVRYLYGMRYSIVAAEQEGYIKGSRNCRIDHFLPECITFNQSTLHHFLPECIAPQTARGGHTEPSSFFAWIPARKIGGYVLL